MNTIQTPQKYVPRFHLKSQLRLQPSVKFQMHILAPSDKRLPMHAVKHHINILANENFNTKMPESKKRTKRDSNLYCAYRFKDF